MTEKLERRAIYITKAQWLQIKKFAQAKDITMSQVIREAAQEKLLKEKVDK